MDYHMLNKATVADKFSIPVIEELLDELQGTRFEIRVPSDSGCDH